MDLNKDNVLKSIKSFIGADNELAIKEAEHQIKIFDVVFQKELLEYSEKDETKKDESLSPDKLEENILILEAIDNYKKEKTKIKEKKAKKEKLNIQSKEDILNKFEFLITKNEELGDLARGIKEIRTEWNKIEAVSPKSEHLLQKKFSKLNESFNYNFNIYKELKENDLKRNFSLKNQVIHELKNLDFIKDFNKLQVELKILQNKWEEIGPTFKEHWDDLKKKYWSEVHIIQKKINAFYSKLKSNLRENLENKKRLIEEVKLLSEKESKTAKEWDILSNQFKELQGNVTLVR